MGNRITPFDYEALVMLESLTEREVVPTEMDDNFTFHVFYNKHNDPMYISAIIDAMRGRYGERFIGVNDYPDNKMLKFTIAYDKHEYPEAYGSFHVDKARTHCGDTYCRQLEEIHAVQVTRLNDEKLRSFVGGGQMTIERCPNGKMWFTFVNNGTFVDAPENSYIVKYKNVAHFEIWPKSKFEKEWERK